MSQPTMTPAEFAKKWRGVTTTEKASAQSHFIDLCRMLGEPTPHEADPTGEQYAFEKRVIKAGGGEGFADVWKRGFFAWEYKGHRADLKAAYRQLLDYKDDLGNPPLFVVSDLERIEIRTNFTGLSPDLITITLDDLAASDPSDALQKLRDVFVAPEEFRPRIEAAQTTEKAAGKVAEIAQSLRSRGYESDKVAHFLDRILFCLFAEDAGLLPKGLFTRLSQASKGRSDLFSDALSELFGKMSDHGGLFGAEEIEWFNGGLFDSNEALLLTGTEISTLLEVSHLNWAKIDPAIFGTLFERGLDPDQRAQLGAHYTDRDAIWALVEPVILRPLRREYVEMQARVTQLLMSGRKVTARTPRDENPNAVFEAFLERLRRVRVLDPACGSGNFLIVSLWALKDLEFEAINWGSLVLQRPMQVPQIGPEAVLGIELNAYAAELARVTIWIGEIQWMLRHGLGYRRDPILKRLDHIENRDALLDLSDAANPREADWPAAEFIVGNPPFLGRKFFLGAVGPNYASALDGVFRGRVARAADLCTYWHEKARSQIEGRASSRAGLLATQAIRGGANRSVLERIKDTGDIFFARADDRWVLAGATVHISFIGQDDGTEKDRSLDGQSVKSINADLTSGIDLTKARRLSANLDTAFVGDQKGGPFDIPESAAMGMLASPNPDGRSNADVLVPWINGEDLTKRPRHMWAIDFGLDTAEEEAALYEVPFEYVRKHVLPTRIGIRSHRRAKYWWLHHAPAARMRQRIAALPRFIVTPTTAKHRIFAWASGRSLPSIATVAIASADDAMFGILHSRVHEVWARAISTQLRESASATRYLPQTSFETFPFPAMTPERSGRVGEAARRLVELREGWLNPPGFDAAELDQRTLTNLYNQRPSWLANAHAELDAAVLDAYGWPADTSDEQILQWLLDLNVARSEVVGASASRSGGIQEAMSTAPQAGT